LDGQRQALQNPAGFFNRQPFSAFFNFHMEAAEKLVWTSIRFRLFFPGIVIDVRNNIHNRSG
jgi:hypothetical protein